MYIAVPSRAPRLAARPAVVLTTMCLGALMAQIDTSVVNLAVKEIGADLQAGVNALQWVVDSYNVVYASLLLTGGTLGDLYGRRRMFVAGVGIFLAGSLMCGLAPDVGVLIGGRALTGLGAALLVPCSLSILTVTYPDAKERAQAIGIWASCNGLAYAIGPTVGGFLVDAAGWRSTFLVAVPISLATVVLAVRGVAESSSPKGRWIDLPGQAWIIAALASLALAVIEGPHFGWTSPAVLGAGALCVVAATMFLIVEARTVGGLVPLDMFSHVPFSASLAIAACMTFGMYGLLFLTPLYLQSVQHASALAAGLELMPMSLTFVVVSTLSGKFTQMVGGRAMMMAGTACMGAGELALAFLVGDGDLLLLEAALVVVGIGLGLNTGPVNNAAVSSVPPARAGTASGLINTARMVGATLGVAVLGTVYAATTGGGGAIADGVGAAFRIGGAVEWLGTLVAFAFIRPGSSGGIGRFAAWRQRRREQEQLLSLSERELRDIGITYVDAVRVAAGFSWWRYPARETPTARPTP